MKHKNRGKNEQAKTGDLKYGTQVLLMSLGAITGILVVIAIAFLIFFKDLIF